MKNFFAGLAVLSGLTLAGCTSSPRWEEAYERCLKKMNPSLEKMKNDQQGAEAGSDVEKEMKKAMVGLAEGMAVSMCETVKEVCQKDPEGAACEGVLKSLE